MVPKEKINKQKGEMITYQDRCIVGIKWIYNKVVATFFSSDGDSKVKI